MDINHIIQFISVAETHSFSEAARRNFVSQSMVSRNMAAMEREIQTRLFVRTNHEVTLTTEGKILLPFAVEIAESLENAKKTIYRIHCGMEGRIKILHDMLSGDIAVDYIQSFCKKHPKIIVDISDLHSGNRDETHGSGSDFTFIIGTPDTGDSGRIKVGEDELCMVLPRALDGRPTEELLSAKLILLSAIESQAYNSMIGQRLSAKGINIASAMRYDSVYNVMLAVNSGMGVTILPQRTAQRLKGEDVKLVPLKGGDTHLSFMLIWNEETLNPAARVFAHMAKRLAREKQQM